ncbi:MAG: hypothetical protein JWP57_4457 [Spirosoma sp.]|nr:hypothetical protein [Spirosoma sp.]
MEKGIFIPQDTWLPAVEVEYESFADYQEAVDGYVEGISIREPSFTLYVNEEGKVRGLPINARATVLWWKLEPEMRGVDIVVGHAVLVPSSAAARELATMIDSEGPFRVEEITVATTPAWRIVNDMRFTNWFQAARHALLLEEHGAITRVVSA